MEQFPNGHSNLVYLVRTDRREYVLRRPPLGPVAPKAHDMAREYRVLDAVHPHFPEAPRVFLLCEDPSVIGSTFFLMERRRGMVIRDSIPRELAAIPDYPRRVSEAFIDCLVRLHSIDVSQPDAQFAGETRGLRGAAGARMGGTLESRQDRRASGNGSNHPMAARLAAALGGCNAGTQRLQARQCDAASLGRPRGSSARLGDDDHRRSAGRSRVDDVLLDVGQRRRRRRSASRDAGLDVAAGLVHARSVSCNDTPSGPDATSLTSGITKFSESSNWP